MQLHNSTRTQSAASGCQVPKNITRHAVKPFTGARSSRAVQAAAAAAKQEAAVASPVQAAAAAAPASPLSSVSPLSSHDEFNQHVREGHYEAPLMQEQASKQDDKQPSIASVLPALVPGSTLDVVVAGCGPAGIHLASVMAKKGINVGLVGPDAPFVNNYGVWVDEFEALGLSHTLEKQYPDAECFFGEGQPTRVGRAYGRVGRRLLREHLLKEAAAAGVKYLPATVDAIDVSSDGQTSSLTCSGGVQLTSRLVTLASGQAAGRFLRYEDDAPTVAAQTAYGIEAEVEGYTDAYDPNLMLFMDYRRHHTGLWGGAGRFLEKGKHPNAGDGLWGSGEEVPTFLYAMPLGGNRVFLEETALVAKPALPFAVLKRRLERRLEAMGVKVTKIHEEEWSYIPVGGPLPVKQQPLTAFGAAANLVHPATGFSVSRSLRQAPEMADAVAAALSKGGSVQQMSESVWDALWSQERRQQAAFHVFGMELLTQLDLSATNNFFNTFFALPAYYWKGFLGSSLSSVQLLVFAFLTFVYAPLNIKAKLVSHLITDPAGGYLIKRYLGSGRASSSSDSIDGVGSSSSSSSSSSSQSSSGSSVAPSSSPAAVPAAASAAVSEPVAAP